MDATADGPDGSSTLLAIVIAIEKHNQNCSLLSERMSATMSKCARPGCQKAPCSSCSVCGREYYCGSICQKLDWKIHKSICPTLKKLPNELQPYREVERVIKEILAPNKRNDVRVLEHLLLYAEYQFGKQIPGTDYREKRDGVRISNFQVEVVILAGIHQSLANYYSQNNSLSKIFKRDTISHYLQRSLSLLNPWLIRLDSNQVGNLINPEMNIVLTHLTTLERNMAMVTLDQRLFVASEGHCQRCLAHSRRLKAGGEKQVIFMFHALQAYCNLRQVQGDLSGAVEFAEECYNLVVEAYDPVHPQVQEAAGLLIDNLIKKGDLLSISDAERYAQVTYSNLRDKKNGMNQESMEVAKGAYNLANVLFKQLGLGYVPIKFTLNDKLLKAEELAREGLRIVILLHGKEHPETGFFSDLLARILQEQNKLGDETRMLYERGLSLSIGYDGKDELNTGISYMNIGGFFFKLGLIDCIADDKRAHLLKAKLYYKEALRIHAKIYGPTHPIPVDISSSIDMISEKLNF